MLQVFNTVEERENTRLKLRKLENSTYYPSGITPPSRDIVKRKFEKV